MTYVEFAERTSSEMYIGGEDVNPIWSHRGKAVSSGHRNRWTVTWDHKGAQFCCEEFSTGAFCLGAG